MTNIPELDKIGRAVAQRLSLRPPQSESLAILGDVATRVADELGGLKDADTADVLRIVQDAYPYVTDFERDFPSLSFALATGVGKTRLMGAFIAWLRETGISRHFLVLTARACRFGRCREFQSQDRLQRVDGLGTGAGSVTVRFVHQQDKIIESSKIVEIGFPDVFLQTSYARHASGVLVGINF